MAYILVGRSQHNWVLRANGPDSNKKKSDVATAPLALESLSVASRVLASSSIAKYYIPKDDFRAMTFACTLFIYGEIMIDHPSAVSPRDLAEIVIRKQHEHPLISLKTCTHPAQCVDEHKYYSLATGFVSNGPPMDTEHSTAMS
jgi:hypothetical protein